MGRTIEINEPPGSDRRERVAAVLRHNPEVVHLKQFPFPRSDTQDKELVCDGFAARGMIVESIEYESYGMWVWVMVSGGALWLMDNSHGGGGIFTLEKR